MSRFLITLWPFTGHLLPQMSIAVALRERGHEVAFYSGEAVRETVEAEGPNVLDLAVGNIGGVWIAKNEISPEDKEQVARVNERWLGAQYGDFLGCALNADLQHRRPGVVVVAVEPDKADIVLETLHLINVLIVSRQLADELANRLL